MPNTYGGTFRSSPVRRIGVDNDIVLTGHFTTANTAAPTISTGKTRGVISIARTGVGVFRITLPFKMRAASVQITPYAYPGGAVTVSFKCAHTDDTAVVDVTVFTVSSGAAVDTTGLELNVRIEGRAK